MATVGTIQLKVTPEVLQSKADTVEQLIKTISNNFQNLADVMQRTEGYWIGSAGDKYRNLYKAEREEISNMMRRLGEHPRDLLTMAGVYREAEISNTGTAQSMPTNVIM